MLQQEVHVWRREKATGGGVGWDIQEKMPRRRDM